MMNQQQQQGQGLMAGGMQPPEQQQQQQQVPVSPSKANAKDDYELFVSLGLELMSAPKTRESMLVIMKSGDPVNALAKALVAILHKIGSASRVRGVEVDDHVKLYASFELITELAKIGKAAKIMDLDKDQIELAFSIAI